VTRSVGALLAIAAVASIQIAAGAQRPSTVTLSIVGTNDVHGGILPENGRGGLALLSGYLKNLRAVRTGDGGAVLLIDAGDMWQGTLESNLREGAPVVAAYNALGYAAAAVGNHEFDFGPAGPAATPGASGADARGALKARAAEARFPFLAANLIDTATERPVAWPNVRPSVLVDAAGIKVGVIGVLASGGLRQTIAANVEGLRLDPLVPTIEAHARQLRSSGATVVVVTAHAGGRCSAFDRPRDVSTCEGDAEIFEVARRLAPGTVDAILAGHTHAGVAHEVSGIPIAEAYSGGRAFSRIDLIVDRATGRVRSHRVMAPTDICARASGRAGQCARQGPPARYEGAEVVSDPAIARLLAPAADEARTLQSQPLGVVLDTPIGRGDDGPGSPLGQLFVDAMRQAAKGDVAINNTNGGLRADFPAGPLTYGRLFRTMPFDNQLVTLQVRAADLSRVLAGELRRRTPRLSVSGVRVEAVCVGGSLRIRLHTGADPIRDDTVLRVVTSDFLALGGESILSAAAPAGGFQIPTDGPLLRDAVAGWLRARGGRFNEAELARRSASVWTLPGPPPVTCSR
jgi:2',3'-cyclic-nucleotide 2'-phosphodiesterase (5'-nucleotidase family)